MEIAVFFETSGYADLARLYDSENDYIKDLKELEKLANENGYERVTERVLHSPEAVIEVLVNCAGIKCLHSRVCDVSGEGTDEGFQFGDILVKDESKAIEIMRKEIAMTNTLTRELSNKEVLKLSYDEGIHYWTTYEIVDAVYENDFYIEFKSGEIIHIDDFNDFV